MSRAGIQRELGASSIALLMACSPALAEQQVCDSTAYAYSTPTARFVDHGDGTVTDAQSRLMWMRCSVGQQWADGNCQGEANEYDWQSARSVTADINARGTFFFNDWRLPQIHELATIAERQCKDPRINLALFPNTPPGWYWSASSRRNEVDASAAFALSFGAGGVKYEAKREAIHVRLVRNDR